MKPLGLGEHGKITTTHADGRWVARCRVRDYSGRQRKPKRSGSSAAEATRRLMDAIEELLADADVAEFTKTSTVAAAAAGWLLMFEGQVDNGKRSPTTLDAYRDKVDRFIVPRLGNLRLVELSTPRVDRFIQAVLKDTGYGTAKLCRSVLSGMCGWLVRQGALVRNPARDLTPLEANSTRAPKALEGEEIRAWLDVLDASDYAVRRDLPEIARFMLATGLRIGEVLGVTWADLDLNNGVVRIERTIVRVKGKGLVAQKVKSAASERPLRLPDWCVERLKKRRIRCEGFEGPVFPNDRGGWRDRNNTARSFRQVRGGSAFEWVVPHTHRKTVATLLDQSGASAREIADQLGHARVSMTQDVYMGRRSANAANATALEAHNPDAERAPEEDA